MVTLLPVDAGVDRPGPLECFSPLFRFGVSGIVIQNYLLDLIETVDIIFRAKYPVLIRFYAADGLVRRKMAEI